MNQTRYWKFFKGTVGNETIKYAALRNKTMWSEEQILLGEIEKK